MKTLLVLLCSLLFACQADAFPKHQPGPKKPKLEEISAAFPADNVVWSAGGGHANGVVLNKITFLTARHLGTPIGTRVVLRLKDGSQFYTFVVSKTTPDIQVNKQIKLAPSYREDRYIYGDIAICRVDPQFPVNGVSVGEIGKTRQVFSIHKNGVVSEHAIIVNQKQWGAIYSDAPNWIRLKWGKANFELGDSGLPWFSFNTNKGQWELVSITSRVALNATQTPWAAEGPRLSSKIFSEHVR